jgi:outer membrane protein TolC
LINIEAGSASGVDVLRTEMEITDMENQLLLLKDMWNMQTVKFNKLLNVASDNRIELPDTLWDMDLLLEKSAVLDNIKSGNHQLANIDFKTDALKYKELATKRAGKPGFSLGIDYFFTGETDNIAMNNSLNGKDAILFPRIGITIPLYRNKYKAMIQEAVYLQRASEEDKIEKTNFLETVFEMAYKEYSDADRRISLYSKQTVLSVKALRILETEYTAAGVDFEELLRMDRKVLKYSLELEKARADKQAAMAFIDHLMGK